MAERTKALNFSRTGKTDCGFSDHNVVFVKIECVQLSSQSQVSLTLLYSKRKM